jgi:hypothetical protein
MRSVANTIMQRVLYTTNTEVDWLMGCLSDMLELTHVAKKKKAHNYIVATGMLPYLRPADF